MTMPTPEKTWQFDVNNAVGGTGTALTDYQIAMMNLVKALVEMPINPWVVMGSSDSSNAGMDSVNRWAPAGVWDRTKLVWATAGSAHSWIVLRQAGIFSLCEICIDLNYGNTQAYNATVLMGFTGFTGGSTTARPTATTISLITAQWLYGSNLPFGAYIHAMQSTDGECSRIVIMKEDVPCVFWLIDKPKNPVTGWTDPVVAITSSNSSTTAMSITHLNDTARANCRIAGTTAACFLTGEGFSTNLIYENTPYLRPNQISGEITPFPVGLVSETTGVKGRHGELFDIWWGPPGVASGSPDGTWPDDSTKKYWSPDALILPWNGLVTTGTTPLTRY
jgi:hypothetical protein